MKMLVRVVVTVLLVCGLACHAQPVTTLTLGGKVVDEDNTPLEGVDVTVRASDGVATRVSTNIDGRFSFEGKEDVFDITASLVGITLREEKVRFLNGEHITLRFHTVINQDRIVGSKRTDVAFEQPTFESSIEKLPVAEYGQRDPNVRGSLPSSPSWEYGALVQGGVGLQDRTDFSFFMVGGHLGKVLTPELGTGLFKGNFEYAVEVFPFWESGTPKFSRISCPVGATSAAQCSAPYTVGGTYKGASITPIILRWNLTHGERLMPWVQGAGGVLWTDHKYPAVGDTNFADPTQTGPGADTSVWNFTPQFGVGAHYFVRPRRSIDFAANAVHISSASLGDKNPGVNTSVQFSVGYSWWK